MKKIRQILLVTAFSLFTTLSAFAQSLNINMATAEQIAETMKGVGKVKATAILNYRKTHGPFKTVEGLTQVKGIGPKTIARNKNNIIVK